MVGEPDVATAAIMLRGLVAPMEKHHKVRVTDEAIVAAVNLSNRYIPARQLPDKAVSLLDTACARVAISQNAKPAAVEDAEVEIASLEAEKESLMRERDLGAANEERIAEIDAKLASSPREARRAESGLGEASARWSRKCSPCARQSRRRPRRARRGRPADGKRRRPLRGAARAPRRPWRKAGGEAAAGRRDPARQGGRTRRDRPGKADDLRACRRAGGRLGRVRLDGNSGRQDGRRRGRDRAQPRRTFSTGASSDRATAFR